MWTLQPFEVHIWTGRIAGAVAVPDAVTSLLSDDERQRALRYRSPLDRTHFTLCRAALRVLLGSYLQADPRALRFSYGAHGKPHLRAGAGTTRIGFNLAHCKSVALYAFALDRDVGVDVEQNRPLQDLEQLIEQVFSPREQAALMTLPQVERQLTFWRGWTQKEAFTKAAGVGLSMPLTSLEVVARPGMPAQIISIGGRWDAARAWHCHEVLIPGHVAMVTVHGKPLHPVVRAIGNELASRLGLADCST
jgi:4'-phosphopantetheinyl transferase